MCVAGSLIFAANANAASAITIRQAIAQPVQRVQPSPLAIAAANRTIYRNFMRFDTQRAQTNNTATDVLGTMQDYVNDWYNAEGDCCYSSSATVAIQQTVNDELSWISQGFGNGNYTCPAQYQSGSKQCLEIEGLALLDQEAALLNRYNSTPNPREVDNGQRQPLDVPTDYGVAAAALTTTLVFLGLYLLSRSKSPLALQ